MGKPTKNGSNKSPSKVKGPKRNDPPTSKAPTNTSSSVLKGQPTHYGDGNVYGNKKSDEKPSQNELPDEVDEQLIKASADLKKSEKKAFTKITQEEFDGIVHKHVTWLKTKNSKNPRGEQAKFENTFLKGIQFEDKNLSESIFIKGKITDAKGKRTNFKDAKFNGTNISHSNFEDCDFTGVIFKYLNSFQVNYHGSTFKNGAIDNSIFVIGDFGFGSINDYEISNSEFEEVQFGHVELYNVSMINVIFKSSKFNQGSFSKAELINIDFNNSTFIETIFTSEQLEKLDLTDKQIDGIKIEDGPINKPKPKPKSKLKPKKQTSIEYNFGSRTQDDTPTSVDLLGRKAVAEGLAVRLRSICKRNYKSSGTDPVVFHLNAPWGAGKSSFYLLLKKEINQLVWENNEPHWAFVEFNAWQHQHLSPSWWSLFQETYREIVHGKDKLFYSNFYILRAKEFWRRLWGQKFNLSLMAGLGVLSIIGLNSEGFLNGFVKNIFGMTESTTSAAIIISIPTLLLSMFAGAAKLRKTLFWGSADAAKSWGGVKRDPQVRLRMHFDEFAKDVERPIFIFIDDLDRCKPAFVVELLESIMTTFRSNKVFFMVAADPQWIVRCFETDYKDFKGYHGDSGRSLGHHFLEKVFPYTLLLPSIKKEFLENYWQTLIQQNPLPDTELDSESTQKTEGIQSNKDQDTETEGQENLNIKKMSGDDLMREIMKATSENVASVAEEKSVMETEEFLQRFSVLVENNPRAMKRLVNAVVFMVISETVRLGKIPDDIEKTKVALWAIIMQRYPVLVDHMRANSNQVMDIVNTIKGKTIKGFEELEGVKSIKPILADSRHLKRVLKGIKVNGKTITLTGTKIREYLIEAKY